MHLRSIARTGECMQVYNTNQRYAGETSQILCPATLPEQARTQESKLHQHVGRAVCPSLHKSYASAVYGFHRRHQPSIRMKSAAVKFCIKVFCIRIPAMQQETHNNPLTEQPTLATFRKWSSYRSDHVQHVDSPIQKPKRLHNNAPFQKNMIGSPLFPIP